MKKGLLAFCIIVFLSAFLMAADVSLKIINMSYQPQDTTLRFTVEMTNTVDVYGLQFDIVDTPDDFEYIPDSLNSYLTGNWQVGSSQPDDERGRVLIYSILGESITSGTSNVVDLFFRLKAETPLSEEVQFKLTDIVASDASGSSYDEVEGDSTTVQVVVSIDEENTILSDFNLAQNYPNPFNPTTQIDFTIPDYAEVNLSVYSLKGELVRTLVDNRRLRGSYSIEWNGKDNYGRTVPSGIYFYTLKTDKTELSKKMLFLK